MKPFFSSGTAAALLFVSCSALAAKCPPLDAPEPTSLPFPPPQATPQVKVPERLVPGETSKVEVVPPSPADFAGMPRPGPDDRMALPDGFVVTLLRMRDLFTPQPPRPLPPWAAKIEGTPLADFRFVGYARTTPSRVARYFEREDGTAVLLEEWDFAADGGAVFNDPARPRVALGPHRGLFGGARGPSGCVSSAISWQDERRSRQLELVGPQDGPAQRREIEEIARALAMQR